MSTKLVKIHTAVHNSFVSLQSYAFFCHDTVYMTVSTTHLGTKIQLFYERAKRRCIFHYCRVVFEFGLSSICDIMSFPIPSFAHLLCSSAKVVHQPLKVERSGGKPFRTESSSYGEYSARKPFPFQCLYSEMQTATEMSD